MGVRKEGLQIARAVHSITSLWDREFPEMTPGDFVLVLGIIQHMLTSEAAKASTDVQINHMGLRAE